MSEQKFNSPRNADKAAWLYRNRAEAEAAAPGTELMFQSFRHSLNGLGGLAWLDKQADFNDGDIVEIGNGMAIRVKTVGVKRTTELDNVKLSVNGAAPTAPVDTADDIPF